MLVLKLSVLRNTGDSRSISLLLSARIEFQRLQAERVYRQTRIGNKCCCKNNYRENNGKKSDSRYRVLPDNPRAVFDGDSFGCGRAVLHCARMEATSGRLYRLRENEC